MRHLTLALLIASCAGAASAQNSAAPDDIKPPPLGTIPDTLPPPSGPQRYQFTRVGENVVRLDTETGHVAVCGPRAVGWACQAAAEDRAALENEISRLQAENGTLSKRLAARDTESPKPPETTPPQVELKLPSKAEIERAKVFIGQAWRRFVEMIENLQKDMRERG